MFRLELFKKLFLRPRLYPASMDRVFKLFDPASLCGGIAGGPSELGMSNRRGLAISEYSSSSSSTGDGGKGGNSCCKTSTLTGKSAEDELDRPRASRSLWAINISFALSDFWIPFLLGWCCTLPPSISNCLKLI